MSLLGKEQILNAPDLPFEDVEVPEWGGTVRIQAMSANAREKMEEMYLDPDGKMSKRMEQFRVRVLASSIIDDQGNLVFTMEEATALGKKAFGVVQRLFDKANKLSGLSDDEADTIKGNLPGGQAEDSNSD
jgi:hypothetical protein